MVSQRNGKFDLLAEIRPQPAPQFFLCVCTVSMTRDNFESHLVRIALQKLDLADFAQMRHNKCHQRDAGDQPLAGKFQEVG